MQHTLVSIFLAALALPAFAQSVPATTGLPDAAPHAMAGQPHPAADAHANAVAGQRNATRIEACSRLASGFLDQLEQGDFKAAVSNFNATMASALGADQLGATWEALGTQFGKLESRGKSQALMLQDLPVVSTPLHFQKGAFVSQVACDQDGKIAGFHIRPAAATSVAPAASTP